ncbi:MAG: hypothetical protein Q7S44_02345 [bacterium]|nr:hypothetical protein [bacterium]
MMGLVSIPKLFLVILIPLALLAAAYGGFWYGSKFASQQGLGTLPSFNPSSISTSDLKSLVKSQQTIMEGVVVKKDSTSITLQASDKKEATIKLSPTLIIYPAPAKPNLPSRATSDISAIQTGKNVLITLESQGSEYLVKTITYSTASSSATKK